MLHKIIKANSTELKDFGHIKVSQLLSGVSNDSVSVSIVKIDGINKEIINHKGDAVYYVLEGQGFFNIDGNKHNVEAGDLIFIPKGTRYFDSGTLKMLSINSPGYDSDNIEYLN